MSKLEIEDVANMGYVPHENEPFMNERQKAFFRGKLLEWRELLVKEGQTTLFHMKNSVSLADELDVARQEIDYNLELRTRDRERKLIGRIDAALRRIESGDYGYCTETGEPITIKRLIARPIATMSIEAQERHERMERSYRMAS